MYIENQRGAANPHDRVTPRDSVRIITGHVRRGLQLAEDANLPQQIMDFIPQHHGTRVLAYFFHKAKSQAEANGEWSISKTSAIQGRSRRRKRR
jgi:membrane-associated HD superfamily phosphohydrolase